MIRPAAVLSLLLAALAVGSPAALGQAPLPIFDDFADGNPTDGSPVSWSPANDPRAKHWVDDAGYHLDSHGALSLALVDGSEDVGDVSIRTVLHWEDASVASEYLGVAARAAFNRGAGSWGFYFGVVKTTGHVSVGTVDPYVETADVLTALDPRTMDIDLQFDVIGDTLSLWAWSDAAGIGKPALPQATMNSHLRSTGQVGMAISTGLGGGETTYRYFEAVPEPHGFLLAVPALVGFLAVCRRNRPRLPNEGRRR